MKKSLGSKGELLASRELEKRGYIVLERNFTCKIGEVDIIAKNNNTLVFIEVRSRTRSNFGYPEETVNYKKQVKLRQVAQYYLNKNHLHHVGCRFDVVGIVWESDKRIKMKLIKNAF